MFYLKQAAGAVATPLVFGFLIFLVGIVLAVLGRRKPARRLWMASLSLVYLSATAPVANALMVPLENRYPAIADVRSLPSVGFVVVLGNSYTPRAGVSITGALEGDGLARIAEGVRLMRQLPGARLVVSGGAIDGWPASAAGYAQFAAEFGVPGNAIIKLDSALDTADEARGVAQIVGKAPYVLVTSAYHMPRAMRLMRRAGTEPIAAPTGQLTQGRISFDVLGWLPHADSLRKTDRAIHEYLGMAFIN